MTMGANDFEYVQELVRKGSAIVLEAGKEYLVESRLSTVARDEGFTSIDHLVAELRRTPANGLHRKVIEAMATKETAFFRDVHPFEALRAQLIPELMQRRQAQRQLTIWCAACSSGQEPYTIAMLLREHFPALGAWQLRILGTDLSSEVLDRAKTGRYNQAEVNRGLPTAFLVKYFRKQGVEWQVVDEIRRMVEFVELNLNEVWSRVPPCDLIFLRNVLIYFDVQTKKTILAKLRRVLRPDGYLFLGGAETTMNLDDAYQRVVFAKTGSYYRLASQEGR
jgi:chemotaxis protein methyltransferase CheR